MKDIIIIGSTGKLGSILLNFCFKNNISIYAATCFQNTNKLLIQKKKFNIKNIYTLSNLLDKKKFFNLIKRKKFKIIYFLDYGSYSLKYIQFFLKNNKKSYFAIANKELIIAGGKILINKIKISNNFFIPLDSEHFSLINSNFDNDNIKNIFITASGGPFYFDKKINLNQVTFKHVVSHPKWSMGINNSIDSSNFINKVLEIFELSIIYNIDLKKINFVLSREALIHSIIIFNDSTISLNCFNNNMLIPLTKPLSIVFKISCPTFDNKFIFDSNSFKIEKLSDKRFKINKYLKQLFNFDHISMIKFMLLNNKAHQLYINKSLNYNDIVDFIFNNLSNEKKVIKINSFKSVLKYINVTKSKYDI